MDKFDEVQDSLVSNLKYYGQPVTQRLYTGDFTPDDVEEIVQEMANHYNDPRLSGHALENSSHQTGLFNLLIIMIGNKLHIFLYMDSFSHQDKPPPLVMMTR